jgi:2'-5' RNA ligase
MHFGESPADALVLFRSQLEPGGARHQPLAQFPLGAPSS